MVTGSGKPISDLESVFLPRPPLFFSCPSHHRTNFRSRTSWTRAIRLPAVGGDDRDLTSFQHGTKSLPIFALGALHLFQEPSHLLLREDFDDGRMASRTQTGTDDEAEARNPTDSAEVGHEGMEAPSLARLLQAP